MKCDQCDSATINGVYCHEHGCPNAVEELLTSEAIKAVSDDS